MPKIKKKNHRQEKGQMCLSQHGFTSKAASDKPVRDAVSDQRKLQKIKESKVGIFTNYFYLTNCEQVKL